MESDSESKSFDQTKKKLFKIAMTGDWDEVIKICKEDERLINAKLTKSGRTALHLAVSEGKEEVVEKLVSMNKDILKHDALQVKDERGDTPLHIAAKQGSVNMCKSIAGADPGLIGDRNHDGETPLFLAVLQGNKRAFFCLHFICNSDDDRKTFSRRMDGETILHCAISGDNFDLAFQIIHLYKGLVNSVNERGQSPLHLLATKPNAFRSGSHLGRCKKIIYHCIFVNKLQKETSDDQVQLKTDEKKMNINFNTLVHRTVKFCKSKFSFDNNKLLGSVTNRGQTRDAENPQFDGTGDQEEQSIPDIGAQGHQLCPLNYEICFKFVKLVPKAMLIVLGFVLGFGSTKIKEIREMKQKHTWSGQILEELLLRTNMYDFEGDGRKPLRLPSMLEEDGISPYEIGDGGNIGFSGDYQHPDTSPTDPNIVPNTNNEKKESTTPEMAKKETLALIEAKNGKTEILEKISELFPLAIHDMNSEEKNAVLLAVENRQTHAYNSTIPETPILIAAKNGIIQIVEKILLLFPVAIHDMNSEKKNIVLLAVENRQPHVYQLLLKMKTNDSVFREVDRNGNNALHLAATLGQHKPWLIRGPALQMQWEINWYAFVEHSMPSYFFDRYNKQNKSPKDVFTETHKDLVQNGGKWLIKTSEACSVVAALIATVAFATLATVPGGINDESGEPTLENHPAFNVFAISSLIALCFSVMAVLIFLSLLTSRYQERDFGRDLPRKLLRGLTLLFVSIASMLISFCAGHFFMLRDKLKSVALPMYAATCLSITLFAIAEFPLYFDLIWSIFKKVPERCYKSIPL